MSIVNSIESDVSNMKAIPQGILPGILLNAVAFSVIFASYRMLWENLKFNANLGQIADLIAITTVALISGFVCNRQNSWMFLINVAFNFILNVFLGLLLAEALFGEYM